MHGSGDPSNSAWRAVAWSMAAGALYDAAFGSAILLMADTAAAWMRLPLPDDRTFLGLNGVFLLLLAGLYGLAAANPRRYEGIVIVAAVGRFGGFVYLMAVWWGGQAGVFAWLAIGDLAFAVAHAALLALARRRARVPDGASA